MISDADHAGPGEAHGELYVEFHDRRADPQPLLAEPAQLSRLLVATLQRCEVPGPAQVDVTWVDPDEIAQLNAEHLGGDGPTDVLSFPLDPYPGDAEADDGWPVDLMASEDDEPLRMVGDVVIASEVARAQAADHAGSPADELALLIVHAGLHLAGHDHAEPGESEAMVALEREILADHWGALAADPWAGQR